MRVLVAGGAGFIGSHLCERLLDEKHEVLCVDNFLTGFKTNIQHLESHKNFTLLEHDVTNPLPKNVTTDAVFHLASPASPNPFSKISYLSLPFETMMVNTQGTLQLLLFAKQQKAKFLFASTSEVYGDPLEHPQKETYYGNVSTTGPRSVYDESKRFGETLTAFFLRNHRLDARIARIFNTYGPRMAKMDMRMVVAFITQALEGRDITVFGDGNQTRSLCYIDDLVEGLMRLMFYPKTQGEIVNLGSQEEHSVLEYAQVIKKLTRSRSEITLNKEPLKDDPKRRRPDISKAQGLLDWEPKVPLEVGLNKFIDYLT